MTLDRIIEGIPLSVKKPIKGIIIHERNLSKYAKLDDKIVLTSMNNPDVLLYIKQVRGFVTYARSTLNHFLIVAREFDVPVYHIKERVREGEFVEVLPRNENIKRKVIKLQIFGNLSNYQKYLQAKHIISLFSILSNVFYKVSTKQDRLLLEITILDYDKLERDILSNPNKYIALLRLWKDWVDPIGVLAQIIGGIVYNHLQKQLNSVRIKYVPYWFRMSERYSKLRFGKVYTGLIKFNKSKYRDINIPEEYRDLYMLYKECVKIYEYKNIFRDKIYKKIKGGRS